MKWLEELKKLDPCGLDTPEDKTQAWGWCQRFKTLKQAWAKCERGDWMFWLWSKHPKQVTPAIHRKTVLCACEIARTALKYVTKGEERPRLAIEAAEKWVEHPTEENRAAAHAAADAASAAAAASSAADAASAARKESAKIVRKHLKPPKLGD